MRQKNKIIYISPKMEIVVLEIEQGFANSLTIDGDWMGEEFEEW